jgi:hypothetical protein
MKELLEKISSYNLFNYLLPGVIYSVAIDELTQFSIISENLVVVGFVCYFIGMVISRIGSIIVEPILKKIGFLKFKDYKDFISASQSDPKLEVLSEQNNTYRSIIAMLLMIAVSVFYNWLLGEFSVLVDWNLWIILVFLLVLFLPAYRKQTNYISKRIEKHLQNTSSNEE